MPRLVPGSALLDALLAPVEPTFAGELVVVDGPADAPPEVLAAAARRLATLPCVVVAAPGSPAGTLVDAAAHDEGALAAMEATVVAAPLAAPALALHLRGHGERTATASLVAESALYSALQGGPEHEAWRAATPVRPPRVGDDGPRVHVERQGGVLRIRLARPAVRNALDARMRDEVLEALAVAAADPELDVVLEGEGASFCAGGDLDEFGTRPDTATAHLVRLRRSVAAALLALAPRTTALVHGPCAGSGVELAAFAHRVVAAPDATFVLPELRMGLVPGAGGTVSVPGRIGRHATMALCLRAEPVDAHEALALGLVDEVRATPLI